MHNQTNSLKEKIAVIFGINRGSIGHIALLDSIQKDLVALTQYFPEVQEWKVAVDEILQKETGSDPLVARKDFLSLQHLPLTTYKLFAAEPASHLSIAQVNNLRAIRAAVLIHLVNYKARISNQLANTLKQLVEGKFSSINFVEFNLEKMMELQHQHAKPGTDLFKLFSHLIQVLRDGFAYEESASSEQVKYQQQANIGNAQDALEQKSTKARKPRTPQPIHEEGDLLSYLGNDLKFATPRDFSGATNQYSGLQPFELTAYFKDVLEEFRGKRNEVSLAILLSFHLRVGPAHFNLVGFAYAPGQNVWLDLKKGFLCWNRLAIVQGLDCIETPQLKDIFCVPLPTELVLEIQIKASERNAKKLGQIFSTPLRELKKEMRRFAFTHKHSIHIPYTGRVGKSVSRFVLSICKDDVYASAISMDFSVTTQSSFSYFIAQPSKLNQICLEVYQKIGYSPILFSPVKTITGFQVGLSSQKLRGLLIEVLNEALTAFDQLNAKSSFEKLINTHHKIVTGVMTLAAASLGLRKAEEYSLCTHTVDLETGRALVTDKASSNYLSVRLLPIPETLKRWLDFYIAWLSRLANRLSRLAPKLALQIKSAVCSDASQLATIPMFFLFENGQLIPVGSKHIAAEFERCSLPVNAGRHVMDFELRNITHASLVNIFMGHANPGQEGLGLRSGLSAHFALSELQTAMDSVLASFKLPHPPQVAQANLEMLKGTKIDQAFRPKLWMARHG